MKSQVTIIYYTSNREGERFEKKIQERLLEAVKGVSPPIPIVSVSQKPISLGKNICVGEKYPCDINIWRQKLIACKAAKTPFVICAEADCLYPPEYFNYVPSDVNHHYRYLNVWIMEKGKDFFYRKESSEGAEMVGREHYIKQIEKALIGKPEWATRDDALAMGRIIVLWKRGWVPWHGKNPVISIKTGDGIRAHARLMDDQPIAEKLPYWGSIEKVKKVMFNG